MINSEAYLHSALAKICFRHFFTKACNVFDVEEIEPLLVLDSLATKVEDYMKMLHVALFTEMIKTQVQSTLS